MKLPSFFKRLFNRRKERARHVFEELADKCEAAARRSRYGVRSRQLILADPKSARRIFKYCRVQGPFPQTMGCTLYGRTVFVVDWIEGIIVLTDDDVKDLALRLGGLALFGSDLDAYGRAIEQQIREWHEFRMVRQ